MPDPDRTIQRCGSGPISSAKSAPIGRWCDVVYYITGAPEERFEFLTPEPVRASVVGSVAREWPTAYSWPSSRPVDQELGSQKSQASRPPDSPAQAWGKRG
jgi:hypothetical protein